jgi:hypothetical protein
MPLSDLLESGFDRSSCSQDEECSFRVRCSQCEALVINGVPCHETGCPNAKRRQRIDEDEP